MPMIVPRPPDYRDPAVSRPAPAATNPHRTSQTPDSNTIAPMMPRSLGRWSPLTDDFMRSESSIGSARGLDIERSWIHAAYGVTPRCPAGLRLRFDLPAPDQARTGPLSFNATRDNC
jgi:hypothetical protein